ncbi:MAG: transcription elongation factor GreA [Limnochordaceae bacterium]|uniref:Transcription elongation factor GreA n=1 Tax=Carboxydichorda subterranea TaxID=3109565 RepID=A0ABZ1BTH9_9FIRM|nr:transcription elongation factor GreA [Limnochorda sp. L945t]MBE3598622.1 transcription elongation factor GreA [Limnochordaceae bacterium]WRP16084.1 transcription elongation factor GreA [Limnochorda sp. L945t]
MLEEELVLTPEGARRLREELDFLRLVKRKEVTQRIRESLDFGDAWENPEYEAAKAEQAFVEGRIAELEKTLKTAKVLDPRQGRVDARQRLQVRLGSRVRLRDLGSGQEESYVIVSSAEADPGEHRISIRSPVAQALLGHYTGDEVTVEVPAGTLQYRIEAVEEPQ